MSELAFIEDLIEERLAKGRFRWLANFKEIHRNYKIGELTFPIYATGGLEEKGFFLSRVFSSFVTPKYKIHFLLYTSPRIDVATFRRLITSCKSRFTGDDWIFIGLVQDKPIEKALAEAVEKIADTRVGVVAYSSTSKTETSSKNVLGNALQKQLRLGEAKFEAFDLPSYMKGFALSFFLGTLVLVSIAFVGGIPMAIQPLTILVLAFLSLIVGYRIYKARYHTTLTLDNKGFHIQQGNEKTEGKWSSFSDVTIYITPKYETCMRLYSDEKNVDLPISRVGLSRSEAYSTISRLVKAK